MIHFIFLKEKLFQK